MSKTEIIGFAKSDTPENVELPHSWAGVGVWLLGKYGVGAIFMAMVYFLYQDLKEAGERYTASSQNLATALNALTSRIDGSLMRYEELREAIRRIEAEASEHKQ